jgi:type I restriction enzyme S subunit
MSYKRLGDYIKRVSIKNSDGLVEILYGINIDKFFMPSVANVIGTDLSRYKVVTKNQFACNRMHVGRDKRLPISLSLENYDFIVSPAYDVFEITDTDIISYEYLMMWFTREEFDRNCWFHTDSDVRGKLDWDAFMDMELPIPSIAQQQQIVAEYNTVTNRITLNNQLNQKLEETAQALYKHWFVGDTNTQINLNEYIEFNPKYSIKKGSLTSYIEMADLQEDQLSIKGTIKRNFKSGSKFRNEDTLLARITPCFENGKTAFVDCLNEDEIAFGSTEFIVMRAKNQTSIYWVYCLARDDNFREHAISSMIGSDGRQRVSSDYLKEYKIAKIDNSQMERFDSLASPLFKMVKISNKKSQTLKELQSLLLAKMTQQETKAQAV